MKIQSIFILLIGLCDFISLSAQNNFTLQTAIDYALTHHNSIKKNLLDQADAEMQIKEYWARGLPKLDGNVGYQYFFELPTSIIPGDFFGPNMEDMEVQFGTKHNLTAGLNMSALLFDGSFLVGLKAQRAYKKLVESEIGQAKRDIRLNVTNAYLNAVILNESKAIIEENIENLVTTRNETQALYDNGFAEQLDVDRLNLTLQNLETEKENINELLISTKIILKYQMGYPMGDEINLTEDINAIRNKRGDLKFSPSIWSWEDRVEVDLLDQTIGLTDINIRSIKASYLPSLTASGGYSRAIQTNELFNGNNTWFPTGVVGLNLAVPLYDGSDKKSRLERAKIQREGLLLQRDDLQRAIELEVRTAYVNLENANRILEHRIESQKLSEKIYATTLVKYREGVGSSLEVNQAKQEMLTAQRNYIDSLYNYLLTRIELERAIGKI